MLHPRKNVHGAVAGVDSDTTFVSMLNAALLIALLCIIMAPLSAHAALIKAGDTITDTSTNKEWYTLTATTNFSWDSMQANFLDSTSAFFGFRYATSTDLVALWSSAGFSGGFSTFIADADDRAAIQLLFDLFGQTGVDCCDRSDGRYDDGDGGDVGVAYLIPDTGGGGQSASLILANRFSTSDQDWDSSSSNSLGSWILRDVPASVPEPGTLALLGLGLVGMGIRRRIKAN